MIKVQSAGGSTGIIPTVAHPEEALDGILPAPLVAGSDGNIPLVGDQDGLSAAVAEEVPAPPEPDFQVLFPGGSTGIVPAVSHPEEALPAPPAAGSDGNIPLLGDQDGLSAVVAEEVLAPSEQYCQATAPALDMKSWALDFLSRQPQMEVRDMKDIDFLGVLRFADGGACNPICMVKDGQSNPEYTKLVNAMRSHNIQVSPSPPSSPPQVI
ncbi:OLC1v1013651C1 [Oldenlandia corymbosa var. corymbosa]|uniref:OLC1v1013651C1 n=1 Tax=Oldenlandia corymbosa var. corymbosa TaxID=529605 RepID=A0AAV1E220_OLDCO|nr:OLC1v1013651C1 [Oldenlandia corymbosa var. corymbosa]